MTNGGCGRGAAYREMLDLMHQRLPAAASVAEVVCCAARRAAGLLHPAVIACYTASGATALRVARERPAAPILGLTPTTGVARQLALAWGVHAVVLPASGEALPLDERSAAIARQQGFAGPGDGIITLAGAPFGQPGTTNLMSVGTS